MSKNGQIEYNSIKINFDRGWNEFTFNKIQRRISQESEAGIKQYLNFFNRDLVRAGRERLTAQEMIELLEWYDYVKDGTSFTFLRDRDLGAFWAFEKTLNNNDENALTFTRTAGTASNASYTDPSTGLLTFEDTLNTPRYDSGKYGHGLVIEGTRTNLVQNQGMDHADWVKTNFTVSDNNTTEILDPAGGNNSDKITAAANGGNAVYTGPAVSTNDGAFSVWIACPSGTVAGQIIIDDASVTNTTTQGYTATPIWQRIQVPYENIGDPADTWTATINITTSGDVIYVYGPQLEAGANVLFASNFILTSGATKDRNTERAKLAPTNIIGNSKGTIAFWFTPEIQDLTKHAGLALFEHGDSGGGDIHLKMSIDTSSRLLVQTWDALGSSIDALETIPSFTAGEPAYIAMTYDSTISNGIKAYYNGVLLKTSTNDAYVPIANQDFFNIGTTRVGGAPAFGIFDEFKIRKDVLSLAQIRSIYQRGRGEGTRRNRWTLALTDPNFNPVWKAGNRFSFQMNAEEVIT